MATDQERPAEGEERRRAGGTRGRPPWPDIVLAALLLLASSGVLVAVATGASRGKGDPSALRDGPFALWVVIAGLLLCLETVPLAFRRRHPLQVLGLVTGA